MTRHTVNTITSDALDALYEQLEAAEDSESQRQLATAREALASAATRAARAEHELAALRQVSRGYCPACGRGDAAPTVADWEQQKQRADQLDTVLRDVLAEFQALRADDGALLHYQVPKVFPRQYEAWQNAPRTAGRTTTKEN
ncbi:hypothetical protein ACIA6D_23395 [Streptomyces cacaoi]